MENATLSNEDLKQMGFEQVVQPIPTMDMGGCNPSNPNRCGPDQQQCIPCSPNGHCGPNACQPNR